ncbi:DUF2867 domain-containing protein [Streptomyces rimosus]|uniref:DUF2867 domain-containing protein n=1 Tax=Streptomyces rimosus TaxID=1927 RepID=UPI00099C3F9E|nr:DUF2867 domain-containing protein [Streptomyces rimosus]
MPSSRVLPVRRTAVDLNGAHYASRFTAPVAGLPSRSPEAWARAVFEEAPAALQRCLYAGWRGGLGLRLGPRRVPQHVLGWPITTTGPSSITLKAGSPLLTARNVLSVDGSVLTWSTFVHFTGRTGRAVWASAAPLHHQAVPFLLKRAIREVA